MQLVHIMHDEQVDIQEHDEIVLIKLERVDEEVLQILIHLLMG